MSSRADLGHFTKQFDIWRRVIEVVIADQATIRFTTDLVIFFAIQFF